MLPAFDWNGGRLQLEFLAGIVGLRRNAGQLRALMRQSRMLI